MTFSLAAAAFAASISSTPSLSQAQAAQGRMHASRGQVTQTTQLTGNKAPHRASKLLRGSFHGPHALAAAPALTGEANPYNWGAIWQHMRAAAVVLEQRTEQEPPWVRLWRGNETLVLDQPEWIKHTVTPGERITQIAVRYGVKASRLMSWNRIRSSRTRLKTGRRLRVQAKRLPVPRQSLVHRVAEGESWEDIAAAYRVEESVLRATNPQIASARKGKRRSRKRARPVQLSPGDTVTVWYDPALPWTVGRRLGTVDQLTYNIPTGSESYGRPEYGRLLNAIQVPDSPLYHKRSPSLLWGSSHAIDVLVGAIAQFRYETGHKGRIQLNSMSLRRGRHFAPHKSHQSGRDVDIHMPLLPGVAFTNNPNADEVDWWATWSLIRSMLETDQVVYVFLNLDLQRRLYEAARSMGESPEALSEVIEWAHGSRKRSIIRHSKGHDDHIHVRFRCGPRERHCHGSGSGEGEPTMLSLRRRLLMRIHTENSPNPHPLHVQDPESLELDRRVR